MSSGKTSVGNYMSLVKIHHTIFSLPFALIGFSLGIHDLASPISIRILLLVILCVLFARNAAMGFNRYTDRELDKKNPRTAFREIPKDIISPRSALFFVIINAILFIVTTGFINWVCLLLSPVALIVVLGYSFTKRFTWLSHLFLGLGLALAPIGAYLAVTARFDLLPVLYSLTVIFWVGGFDIIYALQDIDFDREESLRSIPERFGIKKALWISALFHLLSVIFITVAGLLGPFHYLYWIGFALFVILMVYQHVIVRPGDLSRVNLAFFTTNGIASVIYAVFVLLDIFLLK
ncbi:MAG TPA: UbiA-like polyprenyltransferase [Bacteroidales bacterium]|nr:UbiA-like polyprenyltransferase [Bacteroidales bacterium]